MERLTVTCGSCGHYFGDLTGGERMELVDRPCPDCGEKTHTTYKTLKGAVQLRTGVQSRLIAPWDGLTLTLAVAIYAILVTVAGVVIAMLGTGGRWAWWASYVVISLSLLVVGVLWPQPVIRVMRRLIARAGM